MIEIKKQLNRITIDLKGIKMGQDLCVILTGGEKPHLGALTAGSSLVELNTFTFKGHKENFVTEMVANILKKEYLGNFVICCGIHLDDISKKEIESVLKLCKDITCELCSELKNKFN